MKITNNIFLSVVIVTLLNSCTPTSYISDNSPNDFNQDGKVTYQMFYNELSPYGRWINYPDYGFVWSPSIADFQPYYSNGYWSSTSLGWNWDSGYKWGWAPFHYGRWFFKESYGWLWLPGYEWAPAWVAWRNNTNYYGWAPLEPGMHLGVSVAVNIPYQHWNFIDPHHITDHHVTNYIIHNNQKEVVYNSTTIINNYYYNKNKVTYAAGPRVKDVEKITGKKITPVVVKDHAIPNTEKMDNQKENIHISNTHSNFGNKRRVVDENNSKINTPKDSDISIPKKNSPINELPQVKHQKETSSIPDFPPQRETKPTRRENEIINGPKESVNENIQYKSEAQAAQNSATKNEINSVHKSKKRKSKNSIR